MTSEGLGEMFEGDSADTYAEKFPLVSMGGEGERRPPSALAEILSISYSEVNIIWEENSDQFHRFYSNEDNQGSHMSR